MSVQEQQRDGLVRSRLMAGAPWAIALAAWMLLLLAGKFWLIGRYGNSTPFWDQWDAQAAQLFGPWLEGRLTWFDLVAPHNEHRIVATRLLALLLLEVNGLWNPQLEMVVNAFLHVGALAAIVVLLCRPSGRAGLAFMLLFSAGVFVVPFGWENTLAGFQSQFYFVLMFSMLALCLLLAVPFGRTWWLGIGFAVLAFFSLASGVFVLAAAALTLAVRGALHGFRRKEVVALAGFAALFLIGVWSTPVLPHHAHLRAGSLGQFTDAALQGFAWPYQLPWMAIVRNAPFLVYAGLLLHRRAAADHKGWYIFTAGAWVAAQTVGIAYGRASDVQSSRYLDLHVIGLLVNAAALAALVRDAALRRSLLWAAVTAAGSWAVLHVAVMLQLTQGGTLSSTLAAKKAASQIQESNLRHYLRTGDRETFDTKPHFHLPYPDPERLAMIVDTPAVRRILPSPLQVGAPVLPPAGGPVQLAGDGARATVSAAQAVPTGRLDLHVMRVLSSWRQLVAVAAALVMFFCLARLGRWYRTKSPLPMASSGAEFGEARNRKPLRGPGRTVAEREPGTAPRIGLRALLLCAAFLAALLVRSPDLFTGPRFWAEEGKFYYAALQDGGFWTAIGFVARGNYQLLINAAVATSLVVPAQFAAHVTTGFAVLAALLVVALLAALSVQQRWRAWSVLLGVCVLAWMPSGYEVYLSSTNLQWVCSVSMLLLLLLDARHWSARWKAAATVWVFASALTGVPSTMLTPLMFLRGVRTGGRQHLIWALVLALGAVIQLAIIATHEQADRSFRFDPFVAIVAFVTQGVVAPIAGVEVTERFLAPLWSDVNRGVLVAVITVAALLIYAAAKSASGRPGGACLVAGLSAAALLTATLNIFGAYGNQDELLSAWGGGRYFYLAAVAWLILLVAAANGPARTGRFGATLLLVAGIASGWHEIRTGAWKAFMISGPPWGSVVINCGDVGPCQATVWPGGRDWTFELRRR